MDIDSSSLESCYFYRVFNLFSFVSSFIYIYIYIYIYIFSGDVVHNLWGYQHMDWSYLRSTEAFGGILLMYNMWVEQKIDDCVGSFLVACCQ
jgi:hypothetical protein